MPADVPTILATSGGMVRSPRLRWSLGPLTRHAIDLSGVTGRAPRVCFLATAVGDATDVLVSFYATAMEHGLAPSHLQLFPMPNVPDVGELLLDQDVVWVTGGSVAALLSVWRLHGVDDALRRAWEAGVVLTGVSAGSICWHTGGTTDSFGPELRPVTDGLGLVPYSNGVHYDSEQQRRPVYQSLVADGTLDAGYATDDGAGVLYRGTEFAEALSEVDGAQVYWVERDADGRAVETVIAPRRLAGPSSNER